MIRNGVLPMTLDVTLGTMPADNSSSADTGNGNGGESGSARLSPISA